MIEMVKRVFRSASAPRRDEPVSDEAARPERLSNDEIFNRHFEGMDYYLTTYSHLIKWLDESQGPTLTTGEAWFYRVEPSRDPARKFDVFELQPCWNESATRKMLVGSFDTEKEAREFAERETAIYWFWTDYIS